MRCLFPLIFGLFLMHLLVPAFSVEEVEEVELRLYGAAFQLSDSRPEPEPDAPTLYLDLRRTGDHWWRAFGMAPRLNRGMHDAVIVEQQRDAEGWRLQLLVNFIGDAWVPGGWGEYTVSLRPGEGEGSWQGSYAGTYRGAAVSGGASAQSQLHPAPAADFRPLGVLEHPRLLFRAADLPALREKAATPFGQAAMALMEDSAVGLGMLYHLRGDAAYAERARAAVEVHMVDNENGDKMIRTRYVAWRLEQVALAYDLCYDAWDEAFRGRVVSFMQQVMRRMSREQGNWTEYIIWRPTDALSGAIHYAGGLAALALWGQPGPGPDLPADQPSEPSVAAVAAHNFAILEGQPLAAWVEDEMPAEWLYTGPIAGSADPMVARQRATMAADGAARPTVGASLAGSEQAWQVLDDKALVSNNHTGNRRVICVNKAAESTFHTRHGFFTVIENPEAVTVQVQLGHGGAQLLLNGEDLRNGDVVRLEPGRYDMLVSVPLGQVNPWALVSLRPHLRSLSPEEVEDILDRRRQQQARLAIVNRQRHADWVASGGMDPGVWQAAQLQMFWNGRFFREAMGSGGMQSGSTHALALEGPDILATAHRNVFGRSPSPLPGVENWLPRTLMGMVFAEDGSSSGNNFLTMTPFRIETIRIAEIPPAISSPACCPCSVLNSKLWPCGIGIGIWASTPAAPIPWPCCRSPIAPMSIAWSKPAG